MQGNVPAIRSRYISHKYVGKTCPRDIWSSLIVWGPIWQGYGCPRGIIQGYIPGICGEMCQGQEAGICRTGMLQRYVPGILSSLKVCTAKCWAKKTAKY